MIGPRLLDLFCGAGGAGMGYHRAGFDVVGVDINPQPDYPFTFHQADALEFLAEHGHEYDAIHASPPCQDHSTLRSRTVDHGTAHLLADALDALDALGSPYVVENVMGAKMPHRPHPLRLHVRAAGVPAPPIPDRRTADAFGAPAPASQGARVHQESPGRLGGRDEHQRDRGYRHVDRRPGHGYLPVLDDR